MRKQLLYWYPVVSRTYAGGFYSCELPKIIDSDCGHTLLASALAMPKKTPIRFEEAVRKLDGELNIENIGHEPGQYQWLLKNFVSWISDKGFHIELTGDEFDLKITPVVES